MKQKFISLGAFSIPQTEDGKYILPGSNKEKLIVTDLNGAIKMLVKLNVEMFGFKPSAMRVSYSKARDKFHELTKKGSLCT